MLRIQVFFLLLISYTSIAQLYKPYVLSIPVRDGNSIAADLYTSDTSKPRPVILVQTPYNRLLYRLKVDNPLSGGSTFAFDTANYNYVIVDWRSFYGSSSASSPGYDRGLDGYDIIEWIAKRSWSNGKVGTHGGSALGLIQFQTAKHRPPHLTCAVPMMKDFKTKYSDFFYGGVFRKEHVESLQSLGFLTTNLVLAHPTIDIYWTLAENATDYPEQFNVPMLLISGWFDHFPDDVIRAYNDIKTRSDQPVKALHKLIMGPWLHSSMGKLEQGELTYPKAENYFNSYVSQFFDYYLRGIQNGYQSNPNIRYYQLGAEEWRETSDWNQNKPATKLYLNQNGSLSSTIPVLTSGYDSVIYDPRDPSPAIGGSRFNPTDRNIPMGPYDQRNLVESRKDVLIYSTETLSSPLDISGPVTINLYCSSDRFDSDIAIRLCDVYPDGRSMLMTMGIKRLRLMNSFTSQTLLIPGNVYEASVELQNLALTINKGHKLRIIITSSIYPHFDINLNNSKEMYTPGDTLIAINKIFRSKQYPSSISFPSIGTNKINENIQTKDFTLFQNYPNPFNPTTIISFELPVSGHVSLKVYDVLGKEVCTLIDGFKPKGIHNVSFDKNRFLLSSGIYFYQIRTDNSVLTKKTILQK